MGHEEGIGASEGGVGVWAAGASGDACGEHGSVGSQSHAQGWGGSLGPVGMHVVSMGQWGQWGCKARQSVLGDWGCQEKGVSIRLFGHWGPVEWGRPVGSVAHNCKVQSMSAHSAHPGNTVTKAAMWEPVQGLTVKYWPHTQISKQFEAIIVVPMMCLSCRRLSC